MASRVAVAAAQAGTSRVPKRNFASRVFGYDLFISFALGPPPRGTQSYASDLARRLRERDFTVFFSEDEAAPGQQLNSALLKALYRSRTLVVIANRGTLQEPRWVRQEVEAFRGRHPDRPIISISVDGALQDATLAEQTQQWLAFDDKIWLDESHDAVAQGIASDETVARLAMVPVGRSSNVKWRWVVGAIIAALVILSGAATRFGIDARKERTIAIARAREAKDNADEAERQRGKAETNARKAQDNADEAERQKEEALRERNLAVARQLAAQSELLTNREPGFIDTSLLLAIESMRRIPLFENDVALREALRLLPATGVNTGLRMVTAVAFSPDSRSAAVGGSAVVRIVDLPRGELKREMSTVSAVLSLAFTPDGRFLAAGCSGSLRVFDSATGREIAHIDGLGNVNSLAITNDGRFLATGSDDKTARVFRSDTWQPVGSVRLVDAVETVVFSTDGRYLMAEPPNPPSHGPTVRIRVLSEDAESKGARIFDLVNRKEVPQPAGTFGVEPLALGPNGQYLALDFTHEAHVFSAETGKDLGQVEGDMIRAAAFSQDGKVVVACSGMEGRNKTCRVFDTSSPPEQLSELPEQQHVVTAVSFSPDNSLLATTASDGTIRMFEVGTGDEVGRIPHQSDGPAVFSPESDYIATGIGTDNARIYALSRDEILRIPNEGRVTVIALNADGRYMAHAGQAKLVEIPGGDEPPASANLGKAMAVAISPDGKYFVIGGANRPLVMLNVGNGQTVFPSVPPGRVQALAFSADGQQLAGGGACSTRYGYAWVVTLGRRSEALELANCASPKLGVVRALAFSRDGNYLAIGTEGKRAHVIKLQNREEFLSVAHKENVHSVAFSPDGRYFASGGLNNDVVAVFDMRSRKQVLSLPHSQSVFAIAFSPDSRLMASGGADKTARIFDIQSGKEVSRVNDVDSVRALLFSTDGRYLTTGAGDTGDVVVSRYLLRPADLIEKACGHAMRNLSRSEWRAYLGQEPYRKTCSDLR